MRFPSVMPAGHIIHHVQNAEAPPMRELIVHEVQ
jgi:hypothetical protein